MTSVISNEEFIAKFRDWRALWKPTDGLIDAETSYISKLAEFMGPVALSKVTKAVIHDFYLEEMMRPQSPESRRKTMQANMSLGAFVEELRADFPTFRMIELQHQEKKKAK